MPPGESENEERLTAVVGCRVDGKLQYLITRMDFSLVEGELVTDDQKLIPIFSTAADAWAFATRLYPIDESDADMATLRRGLEEMYRDAIVAYDLDQATRWSGNPGPGSAGPRAILNVWRLLAWNETAPEPARFDPMYFAGLYMGRSPGDPLPEREALIALGMRLDGMVREMDRRGGDDDVWPSMPEMWKRVDDESVAAILRSGIPQFVARLTPDVAAVEARIRQTRGGEADPARAFRTLHSASSHLPRTTLILAQRD